MTGEPKQAAGIAGPDCGPQAPSRNGDADVDGIQPVSIPERPFRPPRLDSEQVVSAARGRHDLVVKDDVRLISRLKELLDF